MLSDSDITRSSWRLTVRVPTDVLEFLLLGFEEKCANRLILDSLTFFPIGGCGLPAGRPIGTCLRAWELLRWLIRSTSKRSSRPDLAGPFPRSILRNLTSCLGAPEMVAQYIEKEQQAGRLAGPFPLDSSVTRDISPIRADS